MQIDRKTVRYIFLVAAGCIVLYWLLHETERLSMALTFLRNLFSPFVMGAALAFVLNVPMRGIENLLRGMKPGGKRRALALVLTFLALVLVVTLVFQLLIPQIEQTIQSVALALPGFFERMVKQAQGFLEEHPQLMEWITQNTDLEKLDWPSLIQRIITLVGNSATSLLNGALTALGSVTSALVNLVIGLVFAVYCLCRKEILARQGRRLLYAFLPERACDEIVRILRMTNSTFSNFISGQCLEACILGCLFAVSMLIFRMPYVPLVSVLVAVTALVPLVGAFVGCILGALFILVSNPLQAVWFVVMFLVLQQIENNLIYPRVVGTSIGLPGMWVLVAVTVGGEVMGIGGMLLMIPLASVLYALLREVTEHRLTSRGIAREKLQDQPPELRSRFRPKRAAPQKKREKKKKTQAEVSEKE